MTTTEIPRVTPQDIEDQVRESVYFVDGTMTVCVMTLKNGYRVVGTAACAHPCLYNKEVGEDLARKDALRQIWPLLGFSLREKLHQEEVSTFHTRLRDEYAQLAARIEKLRQFMVTPTYASLDKDSREDLQKQYCAMIPYLEILNIRLKKLGI